MIWLTWRQFRVQAAVIGTALVFVAVVLIATGPHLVNLYNQYLSQCALLHSCGNEPDPVTSAYVPIQVALAGILLVMPALIGSFWGAPLIARELETGTYRLGWTQSITRANWLWAKIAIVGLASALVGGLLTLMGTWWFTPIERANADQFNPVFFSLHGLVPVGYALFGFALGLTLGVLIRRILPAMASTLLGFAVIRIIVTVWVRPSLLPAKTETLRLTAANASNVGVSLSPQGITVDPQAPQLSNAWVYSARLVNHAGQAPSSHFLNTACASLLKYKPKPFNVRQTPSGRVAISANPFGKGASQAFHQCSLTVAAHFNEVVTLQPSNRFWPLQILETLLFVALSALLVGLSVWWLRHRVA
ncbi:MAG TPA: hypothetical protein VGF87_05730 [Acidimicrobiales bacterium]|jgi:ABC-type transport system involved in multi-copper enzyme maturation permease subunit